MSSQNIVEKYKEAWENKDINLILYLFEENFEYIEYPFKNIIYTNKKELEKYWNEKVVEEQENIKIEILNIFKGENFVIGEMNVEFYSNKIKKDFKLKHIGIFELNENKKIIKYREYWHSKKE